MHWRQSRRCPDHITTADSLNLKCLHELPPFAGNTMAAFLHRKCKHLLLPTPTQPIGRLFLLCPHRLFPSIRGPLCHSPRSVLGRSPPRTTIRHEWHATHSKRVLRNTAQSRITACYGDRNLDGSDPPGCSLSQKGSLCGRNNGGFQPIAVLRRQSRH